MDYSALTSIFREEEPSAPRGGSLMMSSQAQAVRQKQNQYSVAEKAIWDERELDALPTAEEADPRERPVYEFQYAHDVCSEDIYLGLQGKTHATHDADKLIVTISLPKEESAKAIDLDVSTDRVDMRSPHYRLILPLPQRVHDQQGKATWDSTTNVLRLDLKVKKFYEA